MDRNTEGFTQMGGEGANWIGESPFSKRDHVFQNLGDGTYIHSGSLAIRAAVASNTHITFKLLYNDAVAMTGGQKLDGGMTVGQMAAEVLAEGVRQVVVVTDEPEKYGTAAPLPAKCFVHHRRDLITVQKDLAAIDGVTILIYDQTCAAEKRRRRKRGTSPDPDRRVFINTAVCEGCGDCGIKSNCVAVLPQETELGRKRRIDQSACNKDFSCLEGFCPSFVTLHGATPKTARRIETSSTKPAEDGIAAMLGALLEPALPELSASPYSMIVTGVGGTGVVTISAVLAQAAHNAGLGFGSIDMTGIAQKGGAVACHMRIAADPSHIHAIRVGANTADAIIGGDLVVTASQKILETIKRDETRLVYSTYELTTGDFTRKPDLTVPGDRLRGLIADHIRRGPIHSIDAHTIAERLFGDSIYSNMVLLGLAYQLGYLPIPASAIEEAIVLNGTAVETNRRAFRYGRLAAHNQAALERIMGDHAEPSKASPATLPLDELIKRRTNDLTSYQDEALAQRYAARVREIDDLERRLTPSKTGLSEAVAKAYFKLLAIKDEYEVARLYTNGQFAHDVAAEFGGVARMDFHLAPPLLSRIYREAVTGHPRKIRVPGWLAVPAFRVLASIRRIRGSRLDLFALSQERRLERRMIADYEALLDEISTRLSPSTHAIALALAQLPLEAKGYGHVKLKNIERLDKERTDLLAKLRSASSAPTPIPEMTA